MSISGIGLDSTNARQFESAGIKNTKSSSSSYNDSTSSIYALSSSGKNLPDAPEVSEGELEQKAYLDYLQKYIRSYGAPEELERRGLKELEPLLVDEDEKEKIKKKANKNFDPNALDTISETIQDPEKENEIKVVVSKVDENGDMKITRIMSFGVKDGNNDKEGDSNKGESLDNQDESDMNKGGRGSSVFTNKDREQEDIF
ncbi:hypothetical protein SAMN05660337_3467 [Maridesulfovibrio ferrireducens]|uniref:Uncharacterized protein n=1 Tax=Maridesulfovibrio ferrireducens TaxID=246191 RepID=A0A1G9LQK3_9BACT|nr:hypothetical protein [Maridesulfovibrio ferrireducens]SDL64047.1 hypothetical protein SAMN05660337_3467 [Maridesulfovibrio ferrireducens]